LRRLDDAQATLALACADGDGDSDVRAVRDTMAVMAADRLRARVAELEALFQRTHGCHASWPEKAKALEAENARLRETVERASTVHADLDECGWRYHCGCVEAALKGGAP